jgi:HTH-type transcriptional regulator, sugar sensing transcriptional regulator
VTDAPSVDRLVRIGLTHYEARLYVALIRRDGSTPADLARVTRVPRPRVYDVVDSLVAKGLAVHRPGHAAGFVAVDPKQAMARLIEVQAGRLEMMRADAQAAVEELSAAFAEGNQHRDPLDYIEVIRDRDTLTRRFDQLQARVEREFLAFSKEPAVVSVEQNVVGMEMVATHVVRNVYELSLLRDPTRRAGVRRFVELGEQARFVDTLPLKLAVVDERVVMFALPDPIAGRDDLTSVVIEHPDLAAVLKIAFESVWTLALTFDQACSRLGLPPEA